MRSGPREHVEQRYPSASCAGTKSSFSPGLVPGDPEHEARNIRVAEGIPMTDTLVKEVREVAEESGAPLLIGT